MTNKSANPLIQNNFALKKLEVGLTTAQLFERAAGYGDRAKTARTVDAQDALDLLALRYAVLTAQREFEEQRATRR